MEHFEPNPMHSIKKLPNCLLVTRQIFCGFEAKELLFVRNNFSIRKTIARKRNLVLFSNQMRALGKPLYVFKPA